jgi:predicted branched-subunit amino acid permease
LGFLLTDELFSLSGHRKSYASKYRLYYALGAGGSFYLAWNIWTAIGIIAGVSLPDLTNLGLDFAVAATFIALVIPEIRTVPVLVCVLVSAISSLLFSFYGFELSLVAAASVGMLCGYGVQRVRS